MNRAQSLREILRSSTLIGGATAVNIVSGIVRAKLAAVLLGPAGLGLIGLLGNLVTSVAAVASLGQWNAGARELAEARGRGDAAREAAVRRALAIGLLVLGLASAAAVFALRAPLAAWLLQDPAQAALVGWMAIAVLCTVLATWQGAVLTGLRRIGDLARVNAGSALLATLVAALALWWWGEWGIAAYLLAGPACLLLVGAWVLARAPRAVPGDAPQAPAPGRAAVASAWRDLARLGVPFMCAGLAVLLVQLFVRALVQDRLGLDGAGQFHAAWSVSMLYVGFVLSAMGADFFPRLSAAAADPDAANRLVNEQTEVALLLAGPVILLMLGGAPWLVPLLYSGAFGPAVELLQWQVLGDLLKVASWPLGYLLLARGEGGRFLLAEASASAVFVGVVALAIDRRGLDAAGLGFIAMYAFYLPLVYGWAARRGGLRWTPRVRGLLALQGLAALLVFALARQHAVAGAGAALLLAGAAAAYALARLVHGTGFRPPWLQRVIHWPGMARLAGVLRD